MIHERKWKMKRIWPVVLCVAVIGCEENVSPTAPSVELEPVLETVRGPVRGAAQNGTLDCYGTPQQFADGAIPDPVLTADIDCTVSRDRYIQAGWDTKGTSVTLRRHTSAGAIFVSDGMTAYGTLYKCNAGTTESIWHGVATSDDDLTNATIVIECAGEYEEPPPPPPPPDLAQVMGVAVAPGNAQLVVTWTAVDTATGYTVQWTSGSQGYNTGDRQATVTSGSTTTHTIPRLTNGTVYTVRVIATRTGVTDGPPSEAMPGTPQGPPPPDLAQVMGVAVAPGNAQLVVTWTAVDTATGYTVQWTSGSQGYNTGDRQATVTSGSTTTHTIPRLTNGTVYTVRVIATRTGVTDGPPSEAMPGTPQGPPPPAQLTCPNATNELSINERFDTLPRPCAVSDDGKIIAILLSEGGAIAIQSDLDSDVIHPSTEMRKGDQTIPGATAVFWCIADAEGSIWHTSETERTTITVECADPEAFD